MVITAHALRRAFAHYPTGVVAVGAVVGDAPVGMTVSSFVSMSLDPPLVSISVANSSTTWPILRDAAFLGLTVLTEGQEHASQSLSTRDSDRFAHVEWQAGEDGALFIVGGSLHITVGIEDIVPAGDHQLVLLRIVDISADENGRRPLVFHGSSYHRLLH